MSDLFQGQRYTVMGLGTRGGGLGVARFLAERGAVVTVTDMREEAVLAGPMAELAGLPIRYVLGRHEERDFTTDGADVVVRNPGVRRDSRYLRLARDSGVRVEMEMSLFFRLCPAPIVGITGTKGKTTCATICGEMLRAWDGRTVVAGNMGVSALAHLDRIELDTPVVLEISSWQLEALDEHRLAPHVAVLTNISEDHLDAYDGFADYAATKRSIARHQTPGDFLLFNVDDPEVAQAALDAVAALVPFGHGAAGRAGMACVERTLVWSWAGREASVPIPDNPALRGDHQVHNAAAAAAAALLLGAPVDAVTAGLTAFAGVANRMEPVAEIDGVAYVNDTAATAPAAAIAALRSFPAGTIRLLAGGADKQTDLRLLARVAAEQATAIYLLDGTATPMLERLLREAGATIVGTYGSMPEAVTAAANVAEAGETVLLSPGCASFGLFRDEFDRGEQFRQSVAVLQSRQAVAP